jgi:hypothetical protein
MTVHHFDMTQLKMRVWVQMMGKVQGMMSGGGENASSGGVGGVRCLMQSCTFASFCVSVMLPSSVGQHRRTMHVRSVRMQA